MLVRARSGISGLIDRTAEHMLPQPGRLDAGSPPFLPPRSLHAWGYPDGFSHGPGAFYGSHVKGSRSPYCHSNGAQGQNLKFL